MAKIQIKNSFITSSADITISSSMVKFSSGISAKNITGSFSGSIPALTSYYKQGGNSFGTTAILGTNDNQALTFETNASEKVRINTNGNVGIGTTSPATTLNVSGSTRISAGELQIEGNNAALRLYRTSGINYFDWASGQNLYLGTVTSVGGAGRTNKMVILNDGNVGIGTNAPTQRLDLSGSLRIRSSGTYSDPTDNAGFINYDSSGGIFTISARSNGGSTYMAFRTSNSGTGGERMRIINDGNVGIGTSTPSYLLDVYSGNQDVARFYNNQTTFGFILGSTANTSFTNLLWSTSTGNAQFFKNRSSTSWGGADSFNFYTSNGGFAWHPAGVANAMYLTTSGNLGIGSTSPTSAASFNKVVEAYDATSLSYQVNSGGTYKAEFGISSAGGWLGTSTTHDMRLVSNGTERMRILSGGSIGIGTSSPLVPLHVVGQTYINNYAANTAKNILTLNMNGANYAHIYDTGLAGNVLGLGGTTSVTSVPTTPIMSWDLDDSRVGIGTSSPSSLLNVSGTGTLGSVFQEKITNGTTTLALGTNATAAEVQSQGSVPLYLNYGGNNVCVVPAGSGNVGIGTTSPISLLDVRSGYITAGTGVSTSGTTILAGYYTSGHLTVLGTEQSSGGPVLGYAVTPSTSTTGAFLSSTTITIPRSAYTQDGGTHRWFTGPSQTVAIGSAVTTSEKMRLDTNGNLGIGTSSPATLLHVDTSGADARIRVSAGTNTVQGGMIANSGTSLIYAGSITNHGFSLRTNDTDRVRIDTSGNVGIGTTSPTAKLQLYTGASSNDYFAFKVGDAARTLNYIPYTAGGSYNNASVAGGSALFNSISSTWWIGTHNGPAMRFGSDNAIAFLNGGASINMYISGSGNVGIGTTSPSQLLHVYKGNNGGLGGAIIIDNNGSAVANETALMFGDGGASFIRAAISSTTEVSPYYGDIKFKTGLSVYSSLTTRMIIKGDGNVGIGTSSPGAKLQVSSSASTLAASFQGNVGVGNQSGYYYGLCSLVKPTSGLNLNIMYASLSSGYGEILMSNYNDNTGASGWASYIRSYSNPGSDYSSILTFGTSPASLGGPSERMRITAAGYVGIGTSNTTPYSSLFPGQLVIDSGTSNVDGIFVSTNNSNAAELVLTKKNTTNSFGSLLIQHAGTSGDAIVVNYSVNTTTGVSGTNSFKVTTGGDGYFKGNVGIGTTSFVYAAANRGLLEIYGSTDSLISLRNSNNPFYIQKYSTDVYINNTDNGALILNTNNTERARITSVGNVGIGTNNPGYKLDVSGSVFISGVGSKFSGPGSEAGYRLKFYDNGGINNDPGIGLDGAGGGSESMWFNTLNGFYWNMGTNGVKMLLNSSGNLGIGTSTPTSKLHVIETTATGSRIQLGTNSTNSLMSSTGVNDFIILTAPFGPTPASTNNNGAKWGIKLNGSIDSPNTKGKAACIYAVSEEPGAGYNRRVGLALHTSPFDLDSVERLRISNDGNVGIGTTGPLTKLHVAGTTGLYQSANSTYLYYDHTGVNTWRTGIFTDNTSTYIIGHDTGGTFATKILAITMGGSVGIGTTSPGSPLDVYKSTDGQVSIYVRNPSTGTSAYAGLALGNNSSSNGGGIVLFGSNWTTSALYNANGTYVYSNLSGGVVIASEAAAPIVFGTSNTERMRILSGGNVGIGTTLPATMLEVVGATGKNYSTNACATLKLRDTNTSAINVGAAIQFQGFKTGTTAIGNFAVIDGIKENGTSADESGAVRIFTSNSSGTLTEKLRVASDGNVGIGTSTPISKLNTYASGSNLSVFKVDGGNGTLFEVTDQLSGSLFSVNDVSGLPLLEVFSNNRIVAGKYGSNALVISGSSVGIGTTTPAYKLQVNGSFGATTKSFVIDHPTKEGKKLVYGSLESPYHGIRLTGRNILIDGECKVQLPDYIYKLARPESVNIQITPIKCGKVIYVDEISVENNYFVVKYDKSLLESYKNYEFFWDFTATRSDVEELVVEQ